MTDEFTTTEKVFKWWNSNRKIELTNKERAEIIEFSLANSNLRDLSQKYRVSYKVILATIELYAKHPTPQYHNQKSITLKSNV